MAGEYILACIIEYHNDVTGDCLPWFTLQTGSFSYEIPSSYILISVKT